MPNAVLTPRRVNTFDVARKNAIIALLELDLTAVMSDSFDVAEAAERAVETTARRLAVSFTSDELALVRLAAFERHPSGPLSSAARLLDIVFSRAAQLGGVQ